MWFNENYKAQQIWKVAYPVTLDICKKMDKYQGLIWGSTALRGGDFGDSAECLLRFTHTRNRLLLIYLQFDQNEVIKIKSVKH